MRGFFYSKYHQTNPALQKLHNFYDLMHRQPSQLSVKSRCFLVFLSLFKFEIFIFILFTDQKIRKYAIYLQF